MANQVDPSSGFCPQTRTFHSLRPDVPLPPPSQPLSITDYALSLIPPISSSTTVLIDSATGSRISYSLFLQQIKNLASSLASLTPLSKGHVAFILSPASLHIPVLYYSLLSLGVTISPANPIGSDSEVAHQFELAQPVIAFATSSTVHKIPKLRYGTVIIDSPQFLSMIDGTFGSGNADNRGVRRVQMSQSEPAAILFSSGTTGRVKGVLLTHRNLIALIGGFYHLRHLMDSQENEPIPVSLLTLPLFHVFGFFMMIRAISMGETLVLMQRFDFEGMLKAVERYKISYMPVSPPLIVALAKSELVNKYDLSSLRLLGCGGAPLGKEVADNFKTRFPDVEIMQGYGLTESGGGATRMIGSEEAKRHGSVGRLAEAMEAKIVDPVTGEPLPPGQKGELWLKGPTIMKGYVRNEEATAETLDPEGWLKTGDLCYFDSDGFLYIVDRLKELIKYKAYQVPPAELEHILHTHPEIADAAVIPYPDEEAGQIPMAFVVRKPGSNINADEVMEFVAKQVAPYKKIRLVAFINAIPKTPAGKILRRELVDSALSSASSKLYVAGNGFHILGAHTDSPCLKLKPATKVVKGGYLEVGVQTYGGGLWNTWFDRDLTIAGRVLIRQEKEDSTSYLHRLVRIDEPILRIPTLAIHLDRNADGFKPNTQSHLVPILATLVKAELNKAAADNDSIENGQQNDRKKANDKTGSKNAKQPSLLLQLLASKLGCEPDDIYDFELQACDTQPSIVAGAAKEFIFSGRLDNLCMSFCSLKALIDSTSSDSSLEEETAVRMLALFDHEECGSNSAQGAGSPVMQSAVSRVTSSFSLDSKLMDKVVQRSFLVSADMAHALHPNYMDKHEENHQPKLHGGLVIKHNANQRYATNAVTAFIFREVATKHNIPVQDFVVRNDMPCGSTVGPILASGVGIRTVDVGAPQLSMHSIREMCAVDDVKHSYEHFKAFFQEFSHLDAKIALDV